MNILFNRHLIYLLGSRNLMVIGRPQLLILLNMIEIGNPSTASSSTDTMIEPMVTSGCNFLTDSDLISLIMVIGNPL